jgi:hypothetical protein
MGEIRKWYAVPLAPFLLFSHLNYALALQHRLCSSLDPPTLVVDSLALDSSPSLYTRSTRAQSTSAPQVLAVREPVRRLEPSRLHQPRSSRERTGNVPLIALFAFSDQLTSPPPIPVSLYRMVDRTLREELQVGLQRLHLWYGSFANFFARIELDPRFTSFEQEPRYPDRTDYSPHSAICSINTLTRFVPSRGNTSSQE